MDTREAVLTETRAGDAGDAGGQHSRYMGNDEQYDADENGGG